VSSLSTRDAAGPRDCGSGVFIVKGVDGAGDRGSRDITMVDVDTVLVAFLEDFRTWDHFSQVPKYQYLWSNDTQIKGILLYCIQYKIEFVFVT
jgi:hypothetical protein